MLPIISCSAGEDGGSVDAPTSAMLIGEKSCLGCPVLRSEAGVTDVPAGGGAVIVGGGGGGTGLKNGVAHYSTELAPKTLPSQNGYLVVITIV